MTRKEACLFFVSIDNRQLQRAKETLSARRIQCPDRCRLSIWRYSRKILKVYALSGIIESERQCCHVCVCVGAGSLNGCEERRLSTVRGSFHFLYSPSLVTLNSIRNHPDEANAKPHAFTDAFRSTVRLLVPLDLKPISYNGSPFL